jgi:hypothetical protein
MTRKEFKKAWQFVRLTYALYFTDYQRYKAVKQAFVERNGKLDATAQLYAQTCYINREFTPELPTVCQNMNFKRIQNVNIHNDYTPQAIERMNKEHFVSRLRDTYHTNRYEDK